ncbi:hypothetical protein Tco_1460302 [Tanacetum coccineum]
MERDSRVEAGTNLLWTLVCGLYFLQNHVPGTCFRKSDAEANLRGHLGLSKWDSILVIVGLSLTPPDVAPSVSEAAARLVLLPRHGAGDFRRDMSFDTSTSPGYMCVSFGGSGGDYTSSYPPSLVLASPLAVARLHTLRAKFLAFSLHKHVIVYYPKDGYKNDTMSCHFIGGLSLGSLLHVF